MDSNSSESSQSDSIPVERELLMRDPTRFAYHVARDGDNHILRNELAFDPLLSAELTARRQLLETKIKDGDQVTTPLIIASRNGNMESVQLLVSLKADIEARGTVKVGDQVSESCTPLWAAAANGHLYVVKLLLEENADVNSRTLSNSTPLRAAAYDGRVDTVSYLVENGADVNARNISGNTPLMVACCNGFINVAKYLIEHGANVNLQDSRGKTAYQHAVDRGHFEIADELLLAMNSRSSNNSFSRQEIPVYEAARNCNDIALSSYLRQMSEDDRQALLETKVKDGDQFTTPLIIAARNGSVPCVQEVLKFSDVEARGTVRIGDQLIDGCSPLWTAAANGHLDVVKLLMAENVNIDGRTAMNSTPLMAAAYDGRVDIVSCLVENGADLNARNGVGNTPLIMACFNGHLNVAEYLIRCGAKIDIENEQGKTALQYAADKGYSEIVDEISLAVDVSVPRDLRKTLVYKAARDGNDSGCALKNLLRQMNKTERKNALETKTKDGIQVTTPLIIAARNGNENAVRMLLRNEADIEARGTVAPKLFRHGAETFGCSDLRPCDIKGCTSLCAAAVYAPSPDSQVKVLRRLIEHGADVNACDDLGSSSLMLASYSGKMEVVSYLIECGANVNLQNKNGDTALHEAINGGQLEIVKKLSGHGASLTKANLQGLTPPFLASGVEAEYFHFKYSLFPAHFSQVFIIPCLF